MNSIIGRTQKNLLPERRVMNEAGVILLVDKPMGWTSFDVVGKVRALFHLSKVGHAGTLDPKATGLLIVCTGRQTKSVDQFMILDKEYVATMTLGKTTASFDTETEVLTESDASGVSLEALRATLSEFVGRQLQIPPMYSAVKYGGIPLYIYARKGRTVARDPKEIEITAIELIAFGSPEVELRIRCSKGTYIRSLVHDIGQRLGCGAMLSKLRRTAIGPYNVEDTLSIDDLVQLDHHQRITMKPDYDRSIPA